MNKIICENDKILGQNAAKQAAELLNATLEKKGGARLLVSTGASQFTTFEALIAQDIDWSKIEIFHLDEYIGLPETHPASFIKYIKERFVDKLGVAPKKVHFVDTSNGAENIIEALSKELALAPIDVGLVGIGENAHIAFNDPPADFECEDAYKVVTLDAACRKQQLGEGWFSCLDEVPKQAISMTPKQILKCAHIISAVPYKVKAKAICDTLKSEEVTNMVPATLLKTHPNWTLYIDADSASLL
ncbi:MAG: glucosamine-6-phosphate deaminase [Oscillospiraceae bacterium]|nr:glucosamine-6-phosphate deaminase [Oscillospiraceae bacterium]MCL2158939.1 glucosamine-6-phosphate deaminase [Oscillospiraceae bacterium]